LGIELRRSAALAGPVSALDGSFTEEPHRIRHTLGEDTEENAKAVHETIKKLVQHFTWKGVVGCSITWEVASHLGTAGSFSVMEEGVAQVLQKALRGRIFFLHTTVHTTAAGYGELIFGDSAEEASWRGQVVLLCTLGKNVGAVLFNDGRRVRNAEFAVRSLQTTSSEPYAPPEIGSSEFDTWSRKVDEHLVDILESIPVLDRVIVMPTGRTARMISEPELVLPKLVKTQEAARERDVELAFLVQREGAVVRGAALCALVELQAKQMVQLLEPTLNSASSLQSLSEAQLRAIFDTLDVNGSGVLMVEELQQGLHHLGIDRDLAVLAAELDTKPTDDLITMEEFMDWWRQHVRSARTVTISSSQAWRAILYGKPPEGFGDLVLLEVAFTFCRQCRGFEPKFRRLAEENPTIRFVKIVGNGTIGAMDLCTKELKVKASPAFFIFRRGGEQLATWTGTNLAKFEENLAKVREEKEACCPK